jgi:hypothetical protein
MNTQSNVVNLGDYSRELDQQVEETTIMIHWLTKNNVPPATATAMLSEARNEHDAGAGSVLDLLNGKLVETGRKPLTDYDTEAREVRAKLKAASLDLILMAATDPEGRDWFTLIDPLNQIDLSTGEAIEMSPAGEVFCGWTLEQIEACLKKHET